MGLQKTTYNQSATQRGLEKQPAIPMLYQLLGQLSSTQDALRCLLLAYRLGFVMRHAGAGTWYVFKHVSRVLKLLTLSLRNCHNILLLPDHLALK